MTQIFMFMQVHENEEDIGVSLAEEAQRALSLHHNRDTNNTKCK